MLGSFHMCWLNTDREHSATLCVQKRECGGQNTPRVSVSVIRKSKEWWEGWSSTVWGHLAACLSSSNLQKRRSWKQKALWQCWVDRLMKVNKAIKYVEPKQKEVTESVPSFDSRIKIRFKKNKCVRTAACCLQRDAYFLGNWANSNNNGQSHEKRFMLNITHYHKMLISIALTGGPKKQISAVWWQLLGFQ